MKLAHELALEIYRVTDRWSAGERYQLRASFDERHSLFRPTLPKGRRKDRGVLELVTFEALDELRNRCGKVMWGVLHLSI